MCATHHHTAESRADRPGIVWSVLQNKCPRCRRGPLFVTRNAYDLKRFMLMNEKCPVCGQPFDMEPGFYYGTSYVSYAVTLVISIATLIAWWLLIGFSLSDNRFFWWMGLNAVLLIVLQPWLMRFARSVWLAFFVHYSPDWNKGDIVEPERVNKEMMNNW